MASALPYSSLAIALHSSVFPTPVGPVKSRLATGRDSSRTPESPCCKIAATCLTAASCPTTWRLRIPSKSNNRCRSSAVNLPTGIPVRALTAHATSVPVTLRLRRNSPERPAILCILSRSSAAFSKRLSLTASWSSASNSFRAVFFTAYISSIFAWAAPSSRRSMALSGKYRSGKYLTERRTASCIASSVIRNR